MYGQAVTGALVYGNYLNDPTGECISLGHRTTAGKLVEQIRQEMNLTDDRKFSTEMFYDLLNHAIYETVNELKLRELYVCWKNLGVGTSFDLSLIKMTGIKKIVDSVNGNVTIIDPLEFERIDAYSVHGSSVFATQHGETLALSYGSSLVQGYVKMWYYRIPIQVTQTTEKPDIPDMYVHLVKEKVKQQWQ